MALAMCSYQMQLALRDVQATVMSQIVANTSSGLPPKKNATMKQALLPQHVQQVLSGMEITISTSSTPPPYQVHLLPSSPFSFVVSTPMIANLQIVVLEVS